MVLSSLLIAGACLAACGNGGTSSNQAPVSNTAARTSVPAIATTISTPTAVAEATAGPGSKTPTDAAATAPPVTSGLSTIDAKNPCGVASTPPATYDHVIWIWMENHNYKDVIGSKSAPYTTSLARSCGTATRYSQVGSPSLPNYIGAVAGSTFGINSDASPDKSPLTGDNLFRQIRNAGMSARSYEESMPSNCDTGSKGRYAAKHNPQAYFVGADDRQACNRDNVPMGTTTAGNFIADLNNDRLPNFAFVTPDLCNDTHDCSVSTGDEWLKGWLTAILASPAYSKGRTAIFIIYDEDSPMPNVVVAPSVTPGSEISQPFDHYSLLKTTEEMLGLTEFLGRAKDATSMRGSFHM